jgi:hypothetical protein
MLAQLTVGGSLIFIEVENETGRHEGTALPGVRARRTVEVARSS